MLCLFSIYWVLHKLRTEVLAEAGNVIRAVDLWWTVKRDLTSWHLLHLVRDSWLRMTVLVMWWAGDLGAFGSYYHNVIGRTLVVRTDFQFNFLALCVFMNTYYISLSIWTYAFKEIFQITIIFWSFSRHWLYNFDILKGSKVVLGYKTINEKGIVSSISLASPPGVYFHVHHDIETINIE